MKKWGLAAGAAAVLSGAALLLGSMSGTANAAKPHGFNPSFFKHAGHHHNAFRHHRFDGLLAGYTLGGYTDPAIEVLPPIEPIQIPEPPGLTCHRTRETVTVPAENGGTRDITVMRC